MSKILKALLAFFVIAGLLYAIDKLLAPKSGGNPRSNTAKERLEANIRKDWSVKSGWSVELYREEMDTLYRYWQLDLINDAEQSELTRVIFRQVLPKITSMYEKEMKMQEPNNQLIECNNSGLDIMRRSDFDPQGEVTRLKDLYTQYVKVLAFVREEPFPSTYCGTDWGYFKRREYQWTNKKNAIIQLPYYKEGYYLKMAQTKMDSEPFTDDARKVFEQNVICNIYSNL